MTRHITESEWTSEATGRLWSWVANNRWLQNSYTSTQVGAGIVNFLRATGKLQGEALDYGCGKGDLADKLLESGIACTGVDASETSIEWVNTRLQGCEGWKGAFLYQGIALPFPDNSFDVITCVETLEHVRTEDIQPILAELRRTLKPGGALLITTPFQEQLDASVIYCPFCDTEFHRWQHLRSISLEDHAGWCEKSHLTVEHAWAVDFRAFQEPVAPWPGWRHLSWHTFYHWISMLLTIWLDRHFSRPFPLGREFRIRLRRGSPTNVCVLASKSDTPFR